MSKIYKFNKYLYTFIFSIISMSIFIIDFKPYLTYFPNNNNEIVNFVTEFEHSLEAFDIIYVTLWFFILYFYFNVYFDNEKHGKKKLIYIIGAIIFTVVTILGKSYMMSNSLVYLYSSPMQIFKTVIFSFGYYLIYYALLKKILNIKIELKNVKKKRHLL